MSSPNLSCGTASPLIPINAASSKEKHTYHEEPTMRNYNAPSQAANQDAKLKARIRRLRMISRILALLISIGVLILMSMTLAKFLSTQDTYRTVETPSGPVRRTAWAKDTRAWPTWMYFIIALLSTILHSITILSYICSTEKANLASHITSIFDWLVLTGNLAIWTTAASLYRTEKNKNDKPNDLWGWTCSSAARLIQKEFAGQVNFNTYCDVQSASWYVGVMQVVAALLLVVIYAFVWMRWRARGRVERSLEGRK